MMLQLIGKKIKEIRPMTHLEKSAEDWEDFDEVITVIVLEDDNKIYASKDHMGNQPGQLLGRYKGQGFLL